MTSCVRCGGSFEASVPVAYCADCRDFFARQREGVSRKQRPAPGVFADGKFADECPRTFTPADGTSRCGLCGGSDLDSGYGLAGGYGIGVYTYCEGCHAVLDFSPDDGD